ncbi:MAG: sigma-70 family RNA polymerase sigma factor [Polyangiaceae bacterium]|nr:sigma-70 family RNA polymerase sigma factor [Polyangiaceae bacterium]
MSHESPPHPNGSPPQFEDLYAAHSAWLLRLVWSYGVTGRDRMDVAQEVWITVFRRLSTFDPALGGARAWLSVITRLQVQNWRRSRARRPEEPGEHIPEPLDPQTPECTVTQRERAQASIAFLFRAIPDEAQREAYILHRLAGLTQREVADVTEAPESTVQWRLKMARRNLEQAKQAMTEKERDAMRAFLLPFATVDQVIDAADPGVTDEEIAALWSRVSDRIAAEQNGSQLDRTANAQPSPPLSEPPSAAGRFAFTPNQLLASALAVFTSGVVAGALGILAWQSAAVQSHAAMVERRRDVAAVEVPAVESQSAERKPEHSAPTTPRPIATLPPDGNALFKRMRTALDRSPAEALTLVSEHARRFPRENAEGREIIAIRALVRLGRKSEARDRALRLVERSPGYRAAAEAALENSL